MRSTRPILPEPARNRLIEAGRWVELGGVTPKPRWAARLIAAATLVVLVVAGLAIKLAQLQVSEGSLLSGLARANTVHRVVLEAERGIIYDRHGSPLVENTPVWRLEVISAALPRAAGDRAKELAELARITGVPEEQLAGSLVAADPYAQVRIGRNLDEGRKRPCEKAGSAVVPRWAVSSPPPRCR